MVVGIAGFSIASIFIDLNVNELPNRGIGDSNGAVIILLLYCIIVPIFETIISQWLPIKLLKKFTSNLKFIIVTDAILFTLAHWSFGFIYMLVISPAAVIYAWSWIVYDDSFLKALWVTASIHGLSNFLAIFPSLFF